MNSLRFRLSEGRAKTTKRLEDEPSPPSFFFAPLSFRALSVVTVSPALLLVEERPNQSPNRYRRLWTTSSVMVLPSAESLHLRVNERSPFFQAITSISPPT
jgi:hypothetical protein